MSNTWRALREAVEARYSRRWWQPDYPWWNPTKLWWDAGPLATASFLVRLDYRLRFELEAHAACWKHRAVAIRRWVKERPFGHDYRDERDAELEDTIYGLWGNRIKAQVKAQQRAQEFLSIAEVMQSDIRDDGNLPTSLSGIPITLAPEIISGKTVS